MCDTFVALPEATADGSLILAKNSDREPNEAHELVHASAADHPAGSVVRCTYLEIPQVAHTHAVLLAKPYWIWGAEMGANEHGVVIGNEAVFTKVPHEKEPGLIGMDLLRLALERATTAAEAVDVIAGLLERHGQGGDCGHTHDLRYHNSFLVADPSEAWVLETAGREWAVQRATAVRSISNAITIGGGADRASAGLVDHAVAKGWCRGADDFDFGRCYSDRLYTRFSDSARRQCRTTQCLLDDRGRLDPAAAMRLLQDHGSAGATAGHGWTPAQGPLAGLLGQSVCAHAGFGPVRISQTTGSWVSHLACDGTFTHWVTGTAAPCTSTFKPLWFDALAGSGLPDLGPAPKGGYDPATAWWRHEDLHRATLRDYAVRLPLYLAERDALQADLMAAAGTAAAGSRADRAEASTRAFAAVERAEATWTDRVRSAQVTGGTRGPFARAWRSFDRAAGRVEQ